MYCIVVGAKSNTGAIAGGAAAGIIVFLLAVVIILVVIVYCLFLKKDRKSGVCEEVG